MLKHTEPEATQLPPVTVTPPAPEEIAVQEPAITQTTMQNAELQMLLRRAIRGHARLFTRIVIGILCVTTLVPLLLIGGLTFNLNPFLCIFAALIPISLFLIACGIGPLNTKKVSPEIARMIASGGIEAVGPLLEMTRIPLYGADAAAIYNALTALLPQMKVSDAHLLNAAQRRILNSHLAGTYLYASQLPYREDFVLAALRSLEQIGDATSLPAVQNLTRIWGNTPARQRIKQSAIECLPALDAKRRQRAAEPDPATRFPSARRRPEHASASRRVRRSHRSRPTPAPCVRPNTPDAFL